MRAPTSAGAAHFLEYVLFKRTATRSGREVAEQMDLLGGELNAYTGREHTCYHVQVPAEGLAEATRPLLENIGGSKESRR